MTVFRVAQPFGAAEQPPDVARTIWYFKSLHEVGMALSAGLKPRGDEEKVFFGQLVRTSILRQAACCWVDSRRALCLPEASQHPSGNEVCRNHLRRAPVDDFYPTGWKSFFCRRF